MQNASLLSFILCGYPRLVTMATTNMALKRFDLPHDTPKNKQKIFQGFFSLLDIVNNKKVYQSKSEP